MYLKCTDLLNITHPHSVILPLLLPVKISERYGFFCLLQPQEAVSGLVAPLNGWSLLAPACHVLVGAWAQQVNATDGLSLWALLSAITDRVMKSLRSQQDLPKKQLPCEDWSHCDRSEEESLGFVVDVSHNSPQ